MTNLERLAVVLDLACLTEDRTTKEQLALLITARSFDKQANSQTTTNPLLKGQPEVPCTFRDGPPETHSKKGDACRCAGSNGPKLVREPKGGWWRWEEMVRSSWQPADIDPYKYPNLYFPRPEVPAVEDVLVTL